MTKEEINKELADLDNELAFLEDDMMRDSERHKAIEDRMAELDNKLFDLE